MTEIERIEQRLSAVERTITGEIDIDAESLQEVLALSGELAALEDRFDELEERIATLEADVQSIGGYYSEVESVNEEIERHALAAVAAVDRLEDRVDDIEHAVEDLDPETTDTQRAVEQSMADAERTNGDGVDDGAGEDSPTTSDSDQSFPGQFNPLDVEGTNESTGDSKSRTSADENGESPATASSRIQTQQRAEEIVASDHPDDPEDGEGLLDSLRHRLP